MIKVNSVTGKIEGAAVSSVDTQVQGLPADTWQEPQGPDPTALV